MPCAYCCRRQRHRDTDARAHVLTLKSESSLKEKWYETGSLEGAALPWEIRARSYVFLENGFYLFDLCLIICKMKG